MQCCVSLSLSFSLSFFPLSLRFSLSISCTSKRPHGHFFFFFFFPYNYSIFVCGLLLKVTPCLSVAGASVLLASQGGGLGFCRLRGIDSVFALWLSQMFAGCCRAMGQYITAKDAETMQNETMSRKTNSQRKLPLYSLATVSSLNFLTFCQIQKAEKAKQCWDYTKQRTK